MKKARQSYDREFKISIISELNPAKPGIWIARDQGIHPSLLSRWRNEFAQNPERANRFNGYRWQVRGQDRRA